MASSSQITDLYVELGYLPEGYLVQKQTLVCDIQSQESEVVAVGERIHKVVNYSDGLIQSQSSTVAATASRVSASEDTSIASQESTVAAIGSRAITEVDASIQSGPPALDAVVDNIITAHHADLKTTAPIVTISADRVIWTSAEELVSDDAQISGTAHRTVSSTSGDFTTGTSSVSGVAFVLRSISVALESQFATVNGTGVKTLESQSATLISGSSSVTSAYTSGVSRTATGALTTGSSLATLATTRSVTGSGTLVVTDAATVSGTSVRHAIASGDLTVGPIELLEITEHNEKVVHDTHGEVEAGTSSVSGAGGRSVTLTSGALVTGTATLSGTSERVVTSTGALTAESSSTTGEGQFYITEVDASPKAQDAEVSGTGERTAKANGQLVITDVATVSGAGLRIAVASGDLVSGASHVVAAGQNINVSEHAELQSGSSTIVAVVESGTNGTGTLVCSSSTVTVVNEMTSNLISGVARTQDYVTVSGAATRVIEDGTGTLVSDQSSVGSTVKKTVVTLDGNLTSDEIGFSVTTGVVENIIVEADGTIESGPSSIPTVAEVIRVSESGVLTTGTSTVSGTASRGLKEYNQALTVGAATVNGLGEREETADAAIVVDTDSIVVGTTVITSNLLNGIEQSGDATVASSGFRTAIATGAMKSGSPLVTAAGENTIVPQRAELYAGDATVVGLAENIVNANGDLVTGEITFAGVAERISVQTGGGTFRPIIENIVAGIAERQVNAFGDLTADESTLGGTSERTVIIINGQLAADEVGISITSGIVERVIVTADGTMESGPSTVDGTSERTVLQTGGGDLVSDDITLAGVSERIIVNVPNHGTPITTGMKRPGEDELVVYDQDDNLVLHNDTFEILAGSPSFYVSVFGGEQIVHETDDYLTYYHQNGNTWHVVFYNDTTGNWYHEDFDTNPADWSEGFNLGVPTTQYRVAQTTLTDGVRPDNLSTRLYSPPAFFSAAGENIVVVQRADIRSGRSSLEMTSKITRFPISGDAGAIQSQDATVTGGAENSVKGFGILVSGSPTLGGDIERVIYGFGITRTDVNYYAPDNSNNITYSGEDLVITGLPGGHDGTYLYTGIRKIVEFDAGQNRYEYVTDSNYRVWEKDNQNGYYNVVVWVDLLNGWYIFQNENTSIVNRVDGDATTDISPQGVASNSLTLTETIGTNTAGPSTVSGVAERKLNNQPIGQELFSDDATVDGYAERKADVFLPVELETTPVIVSGTAERTIIQTGGGDLRPNVENLVVGVAERLLNNDGLGQQLFTGQSIVTGLAEVIHDNDGVTEELHSGDSFIEATVKRTVHLLETEIVSGDSRTVGLAENEHITDAIALKSQDSRLINVNVSRIITRKPDFAGPLVPVPSENITGVSYTPENIMVLSGFLGDQAIIDGSYTPAPYLGSVRTNGSDYIFDKQNYGSPDARAVYFKKAQHVEYFPFWYVVAWNTTTQSWKIFNSIGDPDFASFALGYNGDPIYWEDGQIIEDADTLTVTLGTATDLRRSGYFAFSGNSQVQGIAERTLNNKPIGQAVNSGDASASGSAFRIIESDVALKAQDAHTTGETERTIDPIDVALTASEVGISTTTGDGDREVIHLSPRRFVSGPSSVTAVVEITSNGAGVIIPGPSQVNGIAERELDRDGQNQFIEVGTSEVSGVAKRTIVSDGSNIKGRRPFFAAPGYATVIRHEDEADLKSGDAHVTAVVKRTVNIYEDFTISSQDAKVSARVFQTDPLAVRGIPISRRILIRDPKRFFGG